ncbi:hypothetical protein Emag_006871 [Eimeria magna]
MEIDGEEAPPEGGPSGGPPQTSSKSKEKPASFFLKKAEEFLSSFPPNVPVAIKFMEKGLMSYPENTNLLERLAGEYAEVGRIEEAKSLLQKAIQLEPSSGATKYCQLAQLEEGLACLPLYAKGIALLEASLSASVAPRGKSVKAPQKNACSSLSPEALETRAQLVAAYCAVAELYLTDLCEEEDAETRAEEAIEKASKLQPESAQAILCRAQLCKVRASAEAAAAAAVAAVSAAVAAVTHVAVAAELKALSPGPCFICCCRGYDRTYDAEGAVAAARRLHSLLKDYQEQLASNSLLLPPPAAAEELNYTEEITLETRVNACRLLVDVGLAEEATEILRGCLEEEEDDRLKRCEIPEEHPMAQHEKQLRELVQKGLLEQQQQQQQEQEQQRAEESESEAATSEDEGEINPD